MRKQQTKMKENKLALGILLGIFCFSIVVSLLDSVSIQTNITSVYFYLLLLLVIATISKPVRLFLVRSVSFIFTGVKSVFTTAISFITHK